MMDAEAIRLIFSSIGGGGVAGVFAYMLFKAYTASVAQTFGVQEKRIDALDKRSEACESDRIAMRAELLSMQRGVIDETRTALNRNAAVLEKLAMMAEERGWSVHPHEFHKPE